MTCGPTNPSVPNLGDITNICTNPISLLNSIYISGGHPGGAHSSHRTEARRGHAEVGLRARAGRSGRRVRPARRWPWCGPRGRAAIHPPGVDDGGPGRSLRAR